MSGARSFLAVVAGLVAFWFFANVLTLVAVHLFAAKPGGGGGAYLTARIVASLLAGELGGAICAAFARTRPVLHGAILGGIVIGLAAVVVATLPAARAAEGSSGLLAAGAGALGAFSGTFAWKALNAARDRRA